MPRILIVGMGRVGLSTLESCWRNKDNKVYCYDRDEAIIASLKVGVPPLMEFPSVKADNVVYVSDGYPLASMDIIFICVGTPMSVKTFPSSSDFLLYVMHGVCELFGQEVDDVHWVIRTTVPVGTIRHLQEVHKIDLISYYPDRIAAGTVLKDISKYSHLLYCSNDKSFVAINQAILSESPIDHSDVPEEIELAKLLEVSWQVVSYAFANEAFWYAKDASNYKFKINFNRVLNMCNCGYLKHRDMKIANPGFVSGYCLTKDPMLLSQDMYSAKTFASGSSNLWYKARGSNIRFMELVTFDLREMIENGQYEELLILGMGYKNSVDDFRYSHGNFISNRMPTTVKKIFAYDLYWNYNNYTLSDNFPKVIPLKTSSDVIEVLRHAIKPLIFVSNPEWSTLAKSLGQSVYDIFGGHHKAI